MSEGDTTKQSADAVDASAVKSKPSTWVKFDDETADVDNHKISAIVKDDTESPAVLNTESVQVNPGNNRTEQNRLSDLPLHVKNAPSTQPSQLTGNNSIVSNNSAAHTSIRVVADPAPALRTIELSTGIVRQGFCKLIDIILCNTEILFFIH